MKNKSGKARQGAACGRAVGSLSYVEHLAILGMPVPLDLGYMYKNPIWSDIVNKNAELCTESRT